MSELNSKRKRVFKFMEWGTQSIADQHLHRAKGRYLDTLMECPKTGEGVHTWILNITTKAIHAKIKWSDAYKQILEAMNNCGRFEQPNEIYSAYQGALRHINSCVDTGSNMERPPKWNAHDPELAEKLIGEFEAEAKKIGVDLYSKPESFQSDSACDGEMMVAREWWRRQQTGMLKMMVMMVQFARVSVGIPCSPRDILDPLQ